MSYKGVYESRDLSHTSYMSGYARKRPYGAYQRGQDSQRLPRLVPRSALPQRYVVQNGRNRTSGFYGRYPVAGYRGRGAELKFFETSHNFTIPTVGAVPASGQLNLIPQGVTESTRVGRKCILKYIQGRWTLNLDPGAAADIATIVTIYVVLDKQCNGAAAAATAVFESANLGRSFRNLANSQRFRILKKIQYNLTPAAGATTAYNFAIKQCNFDIKCNIPLEFDATTGAITEIKSNNVFLLVQTNGSDGLVTLEGTSRVRFSDGS